MSEDRKTLTPPEQVVYANILFYGCWGSLALMAVTYLLYVFGVFPAHIPRPETIMLWSKPVKTYLEHGAPHGWGWVALAVAGKGDFMNFIGIAILAGMTIICYLSLIPAFIRKKEPIYLCIVAAEIMVLILAASGLVGGGAH